MNIALAFSGGGYRAASFNLGVISFLSEIKIKDSSLLEKTVVLSTVSGGTITGAKYAIGVKQGKSISEIYNSLYSFMSEKDLIALALDRLVSNEGWGQNRTRSLINAMADIYDAYLFENEKFGLLLNETPPIHLKHISFNATEFANALQFRFQSSEEIINPVEGESKRGIIGNYYLKIPLSIAQHIRMADVLAASSCFPGGFEPINFPHDFILPPHEEIQDLKAMKEYPVGLMDGGIVDNQGVTPILLAEQRLKRNDISSTGVAREDNVLDLIIVSDVSSPYMEDFKASKQKTKGFWRKLTPKNIFIYSLLVLFASAYWSYFNFRHDLYIPLIFSVIVFTLSLFLFILVAFIKSIPKKMHVPSAFFKPLSKLLKLRLGVYENMLTNRIDSMLKMTNDVFLKHIRRLNYQTIFNDRSWLNRRIMNAIYELKQGEERINKKVKEGTLPEDLIPSQLIQEVATKAASMGTTLWFTKDDLAKTKDLPYNMLDAIIACGQFTMCWNLLEYIDKIKKSNTNTSANIETIIACEEQLQSHWQKFKGNPYWLVSKFNSKN